MTHETEESKRLLLAIDKVLDARILQITEDYIHGHQSPAKYKEEYERLFRLVGDLMDVMPK